MLESDACSVIDQWKRLFFSNAQPFAAADERDQDERNGYPGKCRLIGNDPYDQEGHTDDQKYSG